VARAEWREPSGDWLAAAQYDDLNRYLPLDILTKVDRMTMAHSIEARPPLLDHKFRGVRGHDSRALPAAGSRHEVHLQESDARHPAGFDHRSSEAWLCRAAGALVPRRAAGFARDVLLSPTCRERGIFDTRAVERLFQLHTRGRDLDLQLWTMLSFELWCQRFLDVMDMHDVAPERTRQTLRRPPAPAILATAS
jgi:asparagine synthase (glutamine-hydrolysing)